MVQILIVFLLSFMLTASAEAVSNLADNIIIPGIRVGFITKNTTEKELKQLLLPNQLRRVIRPDAYKNECATEIFPNTKKAAVIFWADENNRHLYDDNTEEFQKKCVSAPLFNQINSVNINFGNYWQTQTGVGIGTSLSVLEKLNGAAVSFSIGPFCGSDYIYSWNNGVFDSKVHDTLSFSVFLDHNTNLEPYSNSADVPEKLKKHTKIREITVSF